MFRGCSSLLYAPVLPVPVGSGAFFYMFRDCKKLTIAPDFPPVAVPWDGYTGMFQGCTSLT